MSARPLASAAPGSEPSQPPAARDPLEALPEVGGVGGHGGGGVGGDGGGGERRRQVPDVIVERRPTYIVGRNLVALAIRLGTWLRIEGREHLPATGGALLVANHQSFLDIPIVATAVGRRHVAFVARDSLARSRFLGWLMRECGCVLVQRGKPDRRALEEMVRHLELGDWVAAYPEGTRTVDGSLGEFKGGALLAARRAGVPLVPIGIRGAFEVWPRGRRLPRPGRIAVRFGPAIDASEPDALERAREQIAAMIGDGRYRASG